MQIKQLKLLANSIRFDIVNMTHRAGSGHPGGALGMADLFAVLYSEILIHDPKKPNSSKRDFVLLSNGHTCPVLYSTLANFDYFPKNKLKNLRKLNSKLQGHPHAMMGRNGELISLPGVNNSGGPLGQGISQAVGLAASLKRDEKENRVYCFVGDGELQEGQCWEAILFAGKQKLNNLTIIVDRNYIQIDGNTEDVMHLDPLHRKFTSFNFSAIDFNGNNLNQIRKAYREANKIKDKPTVLIAKTKPGKGVSFMEGDFHWHGKAPNKEEYEQAIVDLKVIEAKIKRGEL